MNAVSFSLSAAAALGIQWRPPDALTGGAAVDDGCGGRPIRPVGRVRGARAMRAVIPVSWPRRSSVTVAGGPRLHFHLSGRHRVAEVELTFPSGQTLTSCVRSGGAGRSGADHGQMFTQFIAQQAAGFAARRFYNGEWRLPYHGPLTAVASLTSTQRSEHVAGVVRIP